MAFFRYIKTKPPNLIGGVLIDLCLSPLFLLQQIYFFDVDVFKKIDAAWMVRDYETMKAHIADEGNYRFEDGTVVTNGEDFVAKVEEQYQKDLADGVAWGWNTDYAFSVYPSKTEDKNWNEKGQWVNAQFTGSDGSVVIEWYQFDGDQLISWVQTKGQAAKE